MKEPSELVKALEIILKNAAVERTNGSSQNGYATTPNFAYEEMSPEGEMHLRDYWRSIRKRLWLILGLALIVSTIAALRQAKEPDVYQARARVQVDTESYSPAMGAATGNSYFPDNSYMDPEYFNTQVQILTSPTLLRRVVKNLDLEHNRTFLDAPAESRSTAQRLLAMLGLVNTKELAKKTLILPVTNGPALSSVSSRWDSPEPALERLLRRRDRKRRNQRIGAALVALVISVVVVAGALAALERSLAPRPADGPITPDNVSDLHLAWSAHVEGHPTGLAATADAIYVATDGSKQLQRFPLSCGDEATTCRPNWFAHPSETGAAGVWASPDGHVFLTTDRLSAFTDSCEGGSSACPPIATGAVEGDPLEPVGAGGSVVVATGDNQLYAFRQAECGSGTACTPDWVSRPTTTQFLHPVVAGDAVIVSQVIGPSYEAFPVRCATDGAVCDPSATWRLPLGWSRYSPPAISGDMMYMTAWSPTHTGSNAVLLAVPTSCATGGSCRVLWRAPLDGAGSVDIGTPVVAGDHVIVALQEGEVVQAFPLDCGGPRCEALWTGPVDAVLGNSLTPVVLNGVVFAPGQGGGATAFPVDCATDCRPLWTDKGEGAPVPTNAGALAVAGDRIVVAGGEGDTGTLQVFTLGGPQSPVESDGGTATLSSATALAVVAAVVGVALLRRRNRARRL